MRELRCHYWLLIILKKIFTTIFKHLHQKPQSYVLKAALQRKEGLSKIGLRQLDKASSSLNTPKRSQLIQSSPTVGLQNLAGERVDRIGTEREKTFPGSDLSGVKSSSPGFLGCPRSGAWLAVPQSNLGFLAAIEVVERTVNSVPPPSPWKTTTPQKWLKCHEYMERKTLLN